MNKHLYTISTAILIAACGQATDMGTPFSARSGDWQAAMNAGDPDGIAALYASDARILPPNSAAMTGHDAIKEMFGGMIDAGMSVTLTPIETESSGDVAYNVGTYELIADGEVVDSGKFVETWRRGADDAWLMTNDIWNSDLPASMPGGGGDNTHVVVTHEVEDFDHWIAAWRGENSRHDMFKANGVAHAHTFQSADNPNLTGLVFSVSDMEAFTAFMETEEVGEAAAADGVNLETTTFLNEVE